MSEVTSVQGYEVSSQLFKEFEDDVEQRLQDIFDYYDVELSNPENTFDIFIEEYLESIVDTYENDFFDQDSLEDTLKYFIEEEHTHATKRHSNFSFVASNVKNSETECEDLEMLFRAILSSKYD